MSESSDLPQASATTSEADADHEGAASPPTTSSSPASPTSSSPRTSSPARTTRSPSRSIPTTRRPRTPTSSACRTPRTTRPAPTAARETLGRRGRRPSTPTPRTTPRTPTSAGGSTAPERADDRARRLIDDAWRRGARRGRVRDLALDGAFPHTDRYGSDVLTTDWRAPKNGRAVDVPAEIGLVVEEVITDWCGEIVAVDRDLDTVTLEDRRGKRRTFPLGPGFLLEGKPVVAGAAGPAVGSGEADAYGERLGRRPRREGPRGARQPDLRRGPPRRRAGREGLGRRPADRGRGRGVPRRRRRPRRAPARLQARTRSAGSACSSTTSCPAPRRAGSPRASRSPTVGKHVLIVGHPFIDVWQAVKPSRLGIKRWPDVPRNIDWKKGTCQQLGWPHRDQADIARGLEAHPRRGARLRGPRPAAARPGRGAHRLRDRGVVAPARPASVRSGRARPRRRAAGRAGSGSAARWRA